MHLLLVLATVLGLFWSSLALIGLWAFRARLMGLSDTTVQKRNGATPTTTVRLHPSPNQMTGMDMLAITLSILAKYIPFTPGNRASAKPDPDHPGRFVLPTITLDGTLRMDQRDLETFQRAVRLDRRGRPQQQHNDGKDDAASLTAQNGLFLVGLTAPLLIFLLAQHSCPIKPMGAVNTRNRFHFVDVRACRDVTMLMRASQEGHLTYRVQFGGPEGYGVRVKRGMAFAVLIDVLLHDCPILQQRLEFLQFLKRSAAPRYVEGRNAEWDQGWHQIQDDSLLHPQTVSLPRLDVWSPRFWAAFCGDYNPIHMSPLAAKLFGFPSVIAHGNHAVALTIEAVADAEPDQTNDARRDAFDILLDKQDAFVLEVQFVRPMVLPTTLQLAVAYRSDGQQGVAMVIRRGERTCVTAVCYPA